MEHKMIDSLKTGIRGEKMFTCLAHKLIKNGDIATAIDVTEREEYREYDIDFFINTREGYHAVEIKTDSYSNTGNMFYEEYSCYERKTNGCFNKTRANVLLYYFCDTKCLYVFYDVNKFREWYHNRKEDFKERRIKNRLSRNKQFTSLGRLIPRKILEEEGKDFVKKITVSNDYKSAKAMLEAIQLALPYKSGEDINKSDKVLVYNES